MATNIISLIVSTKGVVAGKARINGTRISELDLQAESEEYDKLALVSVNLTSSEMV